MNCLRTTGLLLFLFAQCVHADEPPAESLKLLSELQKYEEKKYTELQSELAIKRAQAATILRAHQDRETKAGNLDKALSIRGLIEQVEKVEPRRSVSDVQGYIDIENSTWGNRDWTWKFLSDGTGQHADRIFKWAVNADGTIQITDGSSSGTFYLVTKYHAILDFSAHDRKKEAAFLNRK